MSQQLIRQSELRTELVSVQKQIESLLVDKERAKKFLAASLVVANNTNLANCSTSSIVQALVGVAMLDLNIDPNISHVYLIPYKGGVQLQVSYKGMIQLLFRSGWCVKAFPVYHCDQFISTYNGWDNLVQFTPNIDDRDESDKDWVIDNLRGIYVVARHADTLDQHSIFVVKKILEKLRKCSPNQKNSERPTGNFWYDWYAEMCMSKAIKKLAKLLPIGDSRAALSVSIDDIQETGGKIDFRQTAETGVIIEGTSENINKPNSSKSVNDIIESTAVPENGNEEEQKKEPIDYTHPISGIEDKIAACNTLAELARFVAELEPSVKAENKDIIIARQEAIKEARKAANNV